LGVVRPHHIVVVSAEKNVIRCDIDAVGKLRAGTYMGIDHYSYRELEVLYQVPGRLALGEVDQ